MKIGFLGTGIMGAPMARHLAEGRANDVTAWNRTIEKARPLAEHEVVVAGSPQEAVRDAEVIVTMLTDGGAVQDVMEQVADALPDGAIWWQASTVGIEATEGFVELAAEHGQTYVDAPVLGTKGPAEEGELVVLAAGDPDALDRLAPLFEAVGPKTVRLGEAGEASRFKLVMNHWVVAVTDAIAETIAFAEGVDIDPNNFLEAIKGGGLDIGYAHQKGPGMIDGELPVAFPLKHALKDTDLILDAARRHDLDLGLAPVVRERFARAAEAGHADDDMGMIVAATRAQTR
jgi:3-hydroxyisobutyrate dehydrogenase